MNANMPMIPDRMELEDIFTESTRLSQYETISPYKTAYFLLAKCMTEQNGNNNNYYSGSGQRPRRGLSSLERRDCALLLHDLMLMCQDDLEFDKFQPIINSRLMHLPRILNSFYQKIEESRGCEEVTMSVDEVICKNETKCLITGKSVIGLFLRKLALSAARHSFTELIRRQRAWTAWLKPGGSYNNKSNTVSPPGALIRETDVKREEDEDEEDEEVMDIVVEEAIVDRNEVEDEAKMSTTAPQLVVEQPRTMYNDMDSADVNNTLNDDDLSLIDKGKMVKNARKFLQKQLHLLQFNETEAFSAGKLAKVCSLIRQKFPRMPEIYLVETANSLRQRDFHAAEQALRQYFDLNAIRMRRLTNNNNNNDNRGVNNAILNSATDERFLRYAPLLNAKLARIFRLRDKALQNLTECVSHAQEANDQVCINLALSEMCSLNEEIGADNMSNGEVPPILSLTLTNALKKSNRLNNNNTPEDAATESSSGLLAQKAHFYRVQFYAKRNRVGKSLITALHSSPEGQLLSKNRPDYHFNCPYSVSADSCLLTKTGETYPIHIENARMATISSMHLANNDHGSSVLLAQQILNANTGDEYCSQWMTEAHAIATVNIAYSLMARGKRDQARLVLKHTAKDKENNNNNNNNNNYCNNYNNFVRLALSLLDFDHWFHSSRLNKALNVAVRIEALNAPEAKLRQALIFAARHDAQKALKILSDLSAVFNERPENSLYYCRCLLLRGTITATLLEQYWSAGEILAKCLELAQNCQILSLVARAKRRMAYVKIACGQLEAGERLLDECKDAILASMEPLETGLYYTNRAWLWQKRARESSADLKKALQMLNSASECFSSANSPLLLKENCLLTARVHHQLGNHLQRNAKAAQFRSMHEHASSRVSWMLIC